MECAPKNQFGLIGSCFFFAFVISNLFVPRLSDVYGRKIPCLLSNSLHVVVGVVILFSHSFKTMLAMHFIMGLCKPGCMIISYAFFSEYFRVVDVPMAGCLLYMFDSLSTFFASLWFMYVSKN